ncbi:hypothetical protein ES708_33712 [subsurface metagenome]
MGYTKDKEYYSPGHSEMATPGKGQKSQSHAYDPILYKAGLWANYQVIENDKKGEAVG